jgi:hypothetical protein
MITGRDSLGSRYLYFNVSSRGFNFHFTCSVADDDVLVVPFISASLVIAESNIASACFSSVSRFMSPPYVVRHSPKWSSLLSSFTISSTISSIKQVLLTSSYSNGYLLISKIFSSTLMFPKDNFMTSVLQLIRALAIAKKGHLI